MHLPLLGSESHIISLLVIILNFSPSLSPSLSHTQTLRKQTKLTKSMSTLNHLFDLPEQICYVQCGFCTTILLVSVPCSSLSMVVTVRCGHCTSLLSVNMMKASFVPFQLLASLGQDDETKGSICEEVGGHRKSSAADRRSPSSSDNEEEYMVPANPVVNKPPEKRQRAPSAYNRFIKEEIRRLKAQNPNIPHKEAFSTAAKNWAHFPPLSMDNKRGGDTHGQDEQVDAAWYSYSTDQVHIQGNDFSERKAARNSIWTKTPFE